MSSFFRCLPHPRSSSCLLSPLLAWVCNLYVTLLCAALYIFISWQLLFRKAHIVRAHTTYSLLHSLDEVVSMLLDVIAYMMLYEACKHGLVFMWIDSLVSKTLRGVSSCMYSCLQHNTSSSLVTLPLTHTLNEVVGETEGELLSGNAYQICIKARNNISNDITKAYFMTRANKLQNSNHLLVNNGEKSNKYSKCYEPLCKGNNNSSTYDQPEEMQNIHNLEENQSTAKSNSGHENYDNTEVTTTTNTFAKFVNNLYSNGVECTTKNCISSKTKDDVRKHNGVNSTEEEEQLTSATHVQENFANLIEQKEIGLDLRDRVELYVSQTNTNTNARISSRSAHNSHAVTTITSTSSSSSPSASPVSSQFSPSTTLTPSQLLLVPRTARNTASSITHQSSTPHEESTWRRYVSWLKNIQIPYCDKLTKICQQMRRNVSLTMNTQYGHQHLQSQWSTVFRKKNVIVAVLLVLVMHGLPRLLVAASNNVSRMLLLLVVRCIVDTLFYFVCLCIIQCKIVQSVHQHIANRPSRDAKLRRFVLPVIIILTLLVIIYITGQLAWHIHSKETVPELQRSILGEPINPCAAEGRVMNNSLCSSWVWPALLPRRTFNFYTGSERCQGANWHTLGFIDDSEMHIDTPLLIIPAMCPDHSDPHVYVERPSHSEYSKAEKIESDDTVWGAKQYHAELEALFGSEEKAKSKKLIVHRTEKSKLITEVEVDLSQYNAHERKAISVEEEQTRRYWPTSKVYEIPLGYSAAYSLSCSHGQHEEVFMFPPILHMAMEPSIQSHLHLPSSDPSVNSAKQINTSQKPAGNVLILLFDALSRQEAARSLPHFSEWMRKFRARQEKLNDSKGSAKKEGYVVLEPLAHTTLGHSTSGNLVPYLSGITESAANITDSNKEQKWNVMNRSLFTIAKETHGDGINTAFNTGFCHDFFEVLMGNKVASSGRGTSIEGIDYYMYEPMCDLEYTLSHSNFNGPYSIVKRCIANRHVHQHLFDYTTYLLRRQMHSSSMIESNPFRQIVVNQSNNNIELPEQLRSHETSSPSLSDHKAHEFFFDISYFIEAHEGTQGVIGQVDDDLVNFMEYIDKELHYFDNPLNSFIFLSDHGNHMGPYYEFTVAGMFERTTPASLYVIHPEVFRRIDANKKKEAGTSERNFRNRLTRLHSAVDIYYTLADLLNIKVEAYEPYRKVKLPPSSLFDANDAKYINSCFDIKTRQDSRPCSLDFCSKEL